MWPGLCPAHCPLSLSPAAHYNQTSSVYPTTPPNTHHNRTYLTPIMVSTTVVGGVISLCCFIVFMTSFCKRRRARRERERREREERQSRSSLEQERDGNEGERRPRPGPPGPRGLQPRERRGRDPSAMGGEGGQGRHLRGLG